MSYHFKGKRFITRGVDDTIPIDIQVKMWISIEGLLEEQVELDYLQIFKISKQGNVIEIKHSQEEPIPFELEYILTGYDIRNMDIKDTKIYVIDNVNHSIMLLATEY